MKKTLRTLPLFAALTLIVSCNDSDSVTNNTPQETSPVGAWQLSVITGMYSQDYNQDGVSHIDMIAELPCLANSTLTVSEDGTALFSTHSALLVTGNAVPQAYCADGPLTDETATYEFADNQMTVHYNNMQGVLDLTESDTLKMTIPAMPQSTDYIPGMNYPGQPGKYFFYGATLKYTHAE